MSHNVTEYYRVLQSITEYNRVLQSITEYYKVLHSITKYYKHKSSASTRTNFWACFLIQSKKYFMKKKKETPKQHKLPFSAREYICDKDSDILHPGYGTAIKIEFVLVFLLPLILD